MASRLDKTLALVTGGSRGIGRAICAALAREGAAVILNYHSDEEAAQSTLEELLRYGEEGMVSSRPTLAPTRRCGP